MVAASPVSHDPQSSMAPVKVHHQFQLLPWPAAAFLQTAAAGDPLTAAGGVGGTCPAVMGGGGDYVGPDAGDVQLTPPPPPPFQRLLSSFGHLSDDDDDDDDAVVNVDEAATGGRGLRQHHSAVGYLHGGGGTMDRLLAAGGPGAFAATAAQHGIIC